MSEPELAGILKGLFAAYRERFHAAAPHDDPPIPILALKRVDVVAVNGAQAIHFFFSDPPAGTPSDPGHTRLHNVMMWPAGAGALRARMRAEPGAHREHVRRTARIRGAIYVHFVLFPEDGALDAAAAAVGARLAEREVARAQGRVLPDEVPEEVAGPADDDGPPWDPSLQPAP